jgi:hypothetical protein
MNRLTQQDLTRKILRREVPFMEELTLEENKQLVQSVMEILNKDYFGQVKDEIYDQWKQKPSSASTVSTLSTGSTVHRVSVNDENLTVCSCKQPSCFWNQKIDLEPSKQRTKDQNHFWGLLN